MRGPSWLQQLVVVVLGCAAAAAMVTLGLWQLQVFRDQGVAASAARAAEPARALAEVASPGAAVRDGYGRTVAFRCTYEPAVQQLVAPEEGSGGQPQVLSACRLATGGVLAVVRGELPGAALPVVPTGAIDQRGVLLPSEDAASGAADTDGTIGSVRIPALVQTWPGPLVDGYVVLSAPDAAAQGLTPAPLVLPEAQGRLRNGAYALQWWVFAAFAIAMAARIARDLGQRAEADSPGLLDPAR